MEVRYAVSPMGNTTMTQKISIYPYISRMNQNAPANKLSLNHTTPTRALNPAYRKEKVGRQVIEAFKEQLTQLFDKADPQLSEESIHLGKNNAAPVEVRLAY